MTFLNSLNFAFGVGFAILSFQFISVVNMSGKGRGCGKNIKTNQHQQSGFIFKNSHARNEPGTWPWMVSMGRQSGSSGWQHICGGSLVTPLYVLTAGHCPRGVRQELKQGHIYIRAGDSHLQDQADDGGLQIAQVARFTVHPNYDRTMRYFDIGVLELSNPLTLTGQVGTICLPKLGIPRDQEDNHLLVVTGWGANQKQEVGKDLNDANVQVYPEEFCNRTHLGQNYNQFAVPQGFTSDLFCGGDAAGTEGTCQGDSGSPAVFFNVLQNAYILTGIVSGGLSCGTRNHPNIYVRVADANILNWIHAQIEDEGLKEATFGALKRDDSSSGSEELDDIFGEEGVSGGNEENDDIFGGETGDVGIVKSQNQNLFDEVMFISGGYNSGLSTEVLDVEDTNCSRVTVPLAGNRWDHSMDRLDFKDSLDSMSLDSMDRLDSMDSLDSMDRLDSMDTMDSAVIMCGGGDRPNSCITTKGPDQYWTRHSITQGERESHSSASVGGTVHLIGGYYEKTSVESLEGGEWRRGSTPYRIGQGSCAEAVGGKVFVAGGAGAMDKVALWDTDTDVWTELASIAGGRRAHGCAVINGNQVVIAGGYDGRVRLKTAGIYHVEEERWEEIGDMNVVRVKLQVVTVKMGGKERVFALGGHDEDFNDLDSVEELVKDESGRYSWMIQKVKMKKKRHSFAALAVQKLTFC